MGIFKKVVSIILASVMLFTSLSGQFLSFTGSTHVNAEGSTPTVDIVYNDFADTANLQLNGASVIVNNAIRFANMEPGESIFTKDKIPLDENLTFSTAFSFKNISPAIPGPDTGGFIFTLQPTGNFVTTKEFQHPNIAPALSIAFTTNYRAAIVTASVPVYSGNLHTASMTNLSAVETPPVLCHLSVAPYSDGIYENRIFHNPLDQYYVADESPDYYHVWIGYDGVNKMLHVICLDPLGEYTYYSGSIDVMLPYNVYPGFMGSLGNSGSTTEINSWYFKNDLSIMENAVTDADEAWLTDMMEEIEDTPIDYNLPCIGQYGSTISWTSSNTDVVAEDGTVTPSTLEQGNRTVTLTATLSKGSATRVTKSFCITVKAPDFIVVQADYDRLTESIILNGNDSLDNIISNMNLPTSGQYGSVIQWESSNTAAVNRDGTVTKNDVDETVTLTAHISAYSVTMDKTFDVTVKAWSMIEEGIVNADASWLDATINENVDVSCVTSNIHLPTSGLNGSAISWETDNAVVLNTEGTVTRPTFNDGDEIVTLTATISKGSYTVTKVFTVIVKSVEQTDAEKVAADCLWLTESNIVVGNNPSLDQIMGNLVLPLEGPNLSTISWTSDNSAVVDEFGWVIRPTYTNGDETVTLTATITNGSFATNRIFIVKVIKLEQTEEEKVIADAAWLTNAKLLNENISLDSVTGDLSLPVEGPNGSMIGWTSDMSSVVNSEGIVTRPTYTKGDEIVTLTATISKGSYTTNKTFTVKVIKLDQTDVEAVTADSFLLTDEFLLNGNSALDNVTGNLNLPTVGVNGSAIRWESDVGTIVDFEGHVTRPSFTEGDVTVTLTATIGKGSYTINKTFIVKVIKLDSTDAEKVAADAAWLTGERILNGNEALDHVIGDLNFPVLGANGSTINWSSDHTQVITGDGKVVRPAFIVGNKTVLVTATITKGPDSSVTKTFMLTVTALEITDEETAYLDYSWLSKYNILDLNPSANAVTGNLSFPVSGPNNSTILWESDTPSLIANDGMVVRPENGQGHQAVNITATVSKGIARYKAHYALIVFQKPDTKAPVVIGSTPVNNGHLSWNTKEITLLFSENIYQGPAAFDNPHTYGIKLTASDTVMFGASINENKLVISAYSNLSVGENKLIIPFGTFIDASGNPMEAYELNLTVDPETPKKIAVISTEPQDLDIEADINIKEIKIRFDSTNLVRNMKSNPIFVREKATKFSRSTGYIISGDTVTVPIPAPLYPGTIYEIVIPEGVVSNQTNNINEAKIIQFRTKYATEKPLLISSNPANGQTGVNVNQTNIELTFSRDVDRVNLGYYYVKLTDDRGQQFNYSAFPIGGDKKRWRLSANPFALSQYRPGTVYTITVPFGTPEYPDQLEYTIQFTTSFNQLTVNDTSPKAWSVVRLDQAVELTFNASVENGPSNWNIGFKDSKGNSVEFMSRKDGNKVTLSPLSLLSPSELYTVTIPEGAYKGEGDIINDLYEFSFYTVKKLDLSLNNLVIPDTAFVGKTLMFDAAEVGNIALRSGAKIVSYEWNIDGETLGSAKYQYHTFRAPGTHKLTLTVIDNNGVPYRFIKDIEVQSLTDIRMTLKDSDYSPRYLFLTGLEAQSVVYEFKLTQEGKSVYGEKIYPELYKDGVLQRKYKEVTSKYGEDTYKFVFIPEYGDFGTFELVFTYHGLGGYKEIIREPVLVMSKQAAMTNDFAFRLYDVFANPERYFEEAETLEVYIQGKKMLAVKKWDEIRKCYVYTIKNANLLANVYYDMQIPFWNKLGVQIPVYVGKDGSDPIVIRGTPIKPGGIKKVSVNYDESSVVYPFTEFYFEGVSAKLVLDVEADWGDAEPGYYEIKSMNERFNIKVKHAGSGTMKIILDPGLELKTGENLIIRMVTKQGVASIWQYCPYFVVVPQPSILGRKLSISLQDREYAVNWPTVFNGAVGSRMGILDGIPVLDGGSFGIGANMPTFEGDLEGDWANPDINLSFGASGGYGQKSKTKTDTKYKKIKKVTAVGYEFDMSVEGALNLTYNLKTNEWALSGFYMMLIADLTKEWSKGYEMLGIGFSAGVGIGGELAGALKVDMDIDDTEYSGFIRFTPHAYLRVSGDFLLASVQGYLNGRIPAEIHFPTGYIGVDISVSASIYAKALTWGDYIYEKELFGVHWDNGKEKFVLKSLDYARKFDDPAAFKLMPREYINKQPVWLATVDGLEEEQMRALTFSSEAFVEEKPDIRTMMENIYPHAELQLVRNQDELWLVWSDDNPVRDAVNRTQLRYSVLQNGTWSEPVWMNDDKTADFSPTVAAAGNGILMAWQNIGKTVTEEEGLTGMLRNSEISVTENVYTADGIAPNVITLTNDDAIDHSPVLAANGDKALLVWTKSQEINAILNTGEDFSEKGNHRLYYSSWNNGIWSEPSPIEDAACTVLDASLTSEGDDCLLLYTLDMDDDLYTVEDREVFARLYDGRTWGEAIRLTDNSFHDSAPKAVFMQGRPFITWLQEGNILYKSGLDGETKAEERLQNIQGDYRLTAITGDRPLISLVTMKSGENMATGVSAFFYDVYNGQWSADVSLTDAENYTRTVSAVFTEEGKLFVALTQADIITEARPVTIDGVEQLSETPAIGNKTDMKLLAYTPVHDIALSKEDGILLSTEFPLPSTMTTVYVTLRNEGDFAENASVRIYEGNPEDDGVLIGEAPLQFIPARSTMELKIPWLVGPEEKAAYNLYAMVQPEKGVQEINTNNNNLHLAFSTADISIAGLICENMSKDDYRVTVTVANSGSKTLEGAVAILESAVDAQVLETKSIDLLKPGQRTVITYMISTEGLAKDEAGKINLLVRVNAPEGVMEDFTENNTRKFTPEPAAIVADRVNPGPGDKNVDPSTVLTIAFNMNVSEGAGYDRIRLIDEDLNVIAFHKELNGNTLTVTPIKGLEDDTEYTLTVPVDAFGDAYGHSLKQEYNLTFTTVSYRPEVVFTYPGKAMEGTPINTQIRLKFNQDIQAGFNFINITGLESENGTIPVSPVIQGEFLILNYEGMLGKYTDYLITIPLGAVQSADGLALQEDYVLTFTTGEETEGTDEDGDSNDPIVVDTPDPNQYLASVDLNGTKRIINIIKSADTAIIKVGALAEKIFSGSRNTVLTIPAVPGATAYSIEIPADSLAFGESVLTVHTTIGSMDIPAGMLSNRQDIGGKTVSITIATVDKSTLPEDVRDVIGNRPVLQINVTINGERITWNNPDAPVLISVPYRLMAQERENSESIIVWYIDDEHHLISVPNACFDSEIGVVTFSTVHLSRFAVGYNKVSYEDVPKGAWYEKAVSFIAARGITKGTGEGIFSPVGNLTRAQFITMLMRAYDIKPDADPEDNFSDAGNTWYTGYLASAKRLGISQGVGNNMFAPVKDITRQEMFTLLYNTLKVIKQLPKIKESDKPIPSIFDFADKEQIAPWAKEAMTFLVRNGTVKGSDGKLKPMSTSTRAEMAQVLYNLLGK